MEKVVYTRISSFGRELSCPDSPLFMKSTDGALAFILPGGEGEVVYAPEDTLKWAFVIAAVAEKYFLARSRELSVRGDEHSLQWKRYALKRFALARERRLDGAPEYLGRKCPDDWYDEAHECAMAADLWASWYSHVKGKDGDYGGT